MNRPRMVCEVTEFSEFRPEEVLIIKGASRVPRSINTYEAMTEA
jgi:hypothetical protein